MHWCPSGGPLPMSHSLSASSSCLCHEDPWINSHQSLRLQGREDEGRQEQIFFPDDVCNWFTFLNVGIRIWGHSCWNIHTMWPSGTTPRKLTKIQQMLKGIHMKMFIAGFYLFVYEMFLFVCVVRPLPLRCILFTSFFFLCSFFKIFNFILEYGGFVMLC